MAGHRPQSKRCTWRSRRPWRPGTPNTNLDPSPNNARPGSTKRQQCWADVAPSRQWCRRRSPRPPLPPRSPTPAGSHRRHANHLYLQVIGDGEPHTLIRPDTISPNTPTETLQQILARDEAPVSASTVLRELNDPAARLFQAVQRYADGLHVAAEQLVGPQTVAELDQADQHVPGLTSEPAWPTLRAHLLALTAETREHPLRHMLTAAAGRDLRTAGDMAAVLYWRLTVL